MKIVLQPGCEYYVNLLYPVVVRGTVFRATRIVQTNGHVMDIPDRDLNKWKHYPLCRRCFYPTKDLWLWCINNTVSPCGKHYDPDCHPFTSHSLMDHLFSCKELTCRKMLHFLQGRQNWLAESILTLDRIVQ